MFPVLIKLGPLTLHTYGLLVATGFVTGLFLAVRQAKRQGISSERILDLGFYILLAAIIGSRLLFVATDPEHYLSRPLEIFKIWEGGLVFYGGLIFAVPVAVWYMNRHSLDKWAIADIIAPSIAIGHAIGRLGCFSAGCCYGAPAEGLPWAVTFLHPETLAIRGVPLHPAQIYESLGELVNFSLLIILRKHQSFKGQLFWTYILFYSVLRFVVEFFRGDEIRGFIFAGISTSQAISVVMAAVAAAVYITKLRGKR